jgi:uncharacterized protein (UPF0128 family)
MLNTKTSIKRLSRKRFCIIRQDKTTIAVFMWKKPTLKQFWWTLKAMCLSKEPMYHREKCRQNNRSTSGQ